MTTLNILNWNCRSLYSNLSVFKVKLYSKEPHIACLCETWLKKDFIPKFTNYTSFFIFRHHQRGGGLAILVRNDVLAKGKNLVYFPTGRLEVQALTIIGERYNIDILNVYNPNCNISTEEFEHYFSQLSENCLIVGDFNAKNSLWDTQSAENQSGRNLVNSLTIFPNLCLVTPPDLPTYYHMATGRSSTLDLCFISTQLFPTCNLELLEDFGSDHMPILINIQFNTHISGVQVRTRWLTGGKNKWNEWSDSLPNLEEQNDLNTYYNKFIDSINIANNTVFKLSKAHKLVKYNKPWWTEDCEKAVKERHHLKQKFKKHPTQDNLIILRRAESNAKKVIKDAKRNSFREFCNSINSRTPIKSIWSNIKRLSGVYKPYRNIPLLVNGQFLTNCEDKANAIADHFEETTNLNKNLDGTQFLLDIAWAMMSEEEKDYNKLFNIYELETCIKNLKNTSPGEDKISNDMLGNLPNTYLQHFLNIINISFKNSILPETWKFSLTIPIIKPSKPESDPKSNRPISLLSCPGKVMEKLINNRLIYFLESTHRLSSTQGGFRSRLCTLDQIARVEQTIRISLINRKVCICIFVDFSSAFDRVWHTGLLYKLCKMGLTGSILRWLKEYLSNRTSKVIYNGKYSSTRPVSSGVPQGSILSPLLFNIMTSDIPIANDVKLAEYADDILFFCSKPSLAEAQACIQTQMNSLHEWSNQWGMKINISKTKGMIFKRGTEVSPLIKIDKTSVQFVPKFKYLGMLLDKDLSWKPHINNLKSACIPRLNILKSISNPHWGADRNILLKTYVSLIRSVLDYGSIFYSTAPHYCLKQLDTVQNQALRIALGVRLTSPIVALEVESNIPPLFIHRKMLMLKYMCRTSILPNHIDVKKDLYGNIDNLMDLKWTSFYLPPLVIRCLKTLNRLDIPRPRNFSIPLIPINPPWEDLSEVFISDFPLLFPKKASNSQVQTIFTNLQSNSYKDFRECYTDGSVITEPVMSSAAAIAIKQNDEYVTRNWKLHKLSGIFISEMFAIYQALLLAPKNMSTETGLVIYTDSLSSVLALQNHNNKPYLFLYFKINELIQKLRSKFVVKVQYIPSHKGIRGNEVADEAAKAAHDNNISLSTPITNQVYNKILKEKLSNLWTERYERDVMDFGKAIFFFSNKSKPEYWPWSNHKSRMIESSLSKLRIGHVGLNNHLFRINKSDTELCECGEAETVDHFLLICPAYQDQRKLLSDQLLALDVPLSRKNLLGGGGFKEPKQNDILTHFANFLISTGKLGQL